jgi:hypothetical protein
MAQDYVGPGALTPGEADTLTETIRQVRDHQARLDAMRPPDDELVPVLLTDYDEESQAYSWREQAFDSDAIRYDKLNGMEGNPDYWPAFTPDGSVIDIPEEGVQVFIRASSVIAADGSTPSKGMGWEIISAPPGTTSSLAVLTSKTYPEPPFIDYEAYWVTDAPGAEGGIDYTLGELVPGTVRHVRNADHVVWQDFDDSGTGSDPVPAFCVHRIWLTPAGQYVFDSDPPAYLFVKKLPEVTATIGGITYFVGWIPVYDQGLKQLVRMVPALSRDLSTVTVIDPP